MDCEKPGRYDNPMIFEYTNIIVNMLCLQSHRWKTAPQPFVKQNDKPHYDHW